MNLPIDKKLIASFIDTEVLYEHAPCGYLSFLPDGTILKINETLLSWLQYSREELLDQFKFSHLISKGGNLHFEMFFRPMINVHGTVRELRYELLKKDGSVLTALISAVASKDPSGKPVVINAAIYDITDRKKYEYELLIAKKHAEEEKRKFKFLADLIPEMIWTATPSGDIDYVNQRFWEYFGSSSKALTKSAILDKVITDDQEKLIESWRSSVQNKHELNCEVRLVNKNGQPIWHVLRAEPYVNDQGNVEKWFGACSNIDDHVKALQNKDDFITIASHELKTPLTSLKATLQMLNRDQLPTPQLYLMLVGQANRSMDKINLLINDLLDVSRVAAGHISLKRTEFNIVQALHTCCQSMFVNKKYKLVVLGDQNIQVFADLQRIEQVIINFINNAIKYAPQSHEIELIIEELPSSVKISVKDSGPGISPDKISHLFERYYRVDKGGSQYAGLGLGLYICADIIKRHNGKIGVDSQLGEGSTFWFTIPSNVNTDNSSTSVTTG